MCSFSDVSMSSVVSRRFESVAVSIFKGHVYELGFESSVCAQTPYPNSCTYPLKMEDMDVSKKEHNYSQIHESFDQSFKYFFSANIHIVMLFNFFYFVLKYSGCV